MQNGNALPKHVGIILDGNRRYAKRRGMPQLLGHRKGFEKVKELLEWCKTFKIPELTLYAFSTENFNRSIEEVSYLMNIFRDELGTLYKDPRIKEIKINVIGRTYLFPKDVQESLHTLTEKTKNNTPYLINVALGYGGRAEIVDAAKKVAHHVKNGTLAIEQIDETTFSTHLYTNSDADLLIRPGGEKRTSNFLMWQGAYAEWIFHDKTWPEFTKEDFAACLQEYAQRERRQGK